LLHSLCHSRLAPYLGSREAAAVRARETASR
jgi:hypothetical protein